MKLFVEKGELMLPDDFAFEIEKNNPFFSGDGTASVPVTLPATADTRAKLGYPDRVNRSYRFTRNIPALLRHSVFNKRCSLIIDSFANESGFTASLAFEESQMYTDLQDTNLKELFRAATYPFEGATTPTAIARKLYEAYSDMSYSHPDITAFPVALNKQEDGSFFVANEPNDGGTNFICEVRTVTVDGGTENVPEGYGVIPFIMLPHFLEKTFELAGYRVVRNDFGDRPFWDIAILNNCVDALCGQSSIKYRDLVPSMTFGELLEWLKNKFCAGVYIKNRDISIILFKNMYNDVPDIDLTEYVKDDYVVQYADAKQLGLECKTGIDGAEPAYNTIEDLNKQPYKIAASEWWSPSTHKSVLYVEPTGQVIERFWSRGTDGIDSWRAGDLLGSNCIPFRTNSPFQVESYSAADEFVPQLILASKGALKSVHSALPYIGERLHNHTTAAGEESDSSEPADQSLMITWCLYGSIYRRGGNSQPYDNYELKQRLYYDYTTGTNVPYPALTPYGLYDFCWREYDSIIINSAPKVDLNLNIPAAKLLSIDMSKPVLLNGVKAFVLSYSMEMSTTSITCRSMRLQLLPDYRDALSSEILSNIPAGYELVWQVIAIRPLESLQYEPLYPAYTMDDAPSYPPTYVGEMALTRTNYVKISAGSLSIIRYKWMEYFKAVLREVE